jgi:IS605 OrfB family transposase
MSILTFRYRIKDSTHRTHLLRLAHAVNYVWNFCNETALLVWRREKRFVSAFELINLTAGAGHDLGLHTDTLSEICQEYVRRRKQAKKLRLKWRSQKRSLGWIPFKGRCIRVEDDTVVYKGRRFRLWLSRPIAGTIKTGSFGQDAQGRWYVNFQCEVDDPGTPIGTDEIGIDLGLMDQIACSNGNTYSRANLTRTHETALATAQRARKKKRIKAIHAKMANCRKDWTHKVTTAIVCMAKLIVVGNVSAPKLAKTLMAKSVYDAAWGMTRTFLQYKALRLGASYRDVNESRSSLTCADCLAKTGPRGLRGLGVRVWCCVECGALHQRDHNSARIILRLGRETLVPGIP